MKDILAGFFKEEDGIETLEMVIILAILIGLAFLFKEKMAEFVDYIFGKSKEKSDDLFSKP